MITTGYPRSSSTKTEIVDLANGITCSVLADFPIELSSAVIGYLDETPVVCGGFLGYSTYSEKCYRLKNGGWEEFASMREKRYAAVGVMYNRVSQIWKIFGNSHHK